MPTYFFGRRIDHLTPRFVVNRLREKRFERSHPDAPWFNPYAVCLLQGLLRAQDSGLEWGSGRSTVWFAQRTLGLVSVESVPLWFQKISSELRRRNLSNVDYRLVETDPQSADEASRERYVRADGAIDDRLFDYVVVDGIFRDQCASVAPGLVKPGGLLIVDDAHWFLPHHSRSLDAVCDYPSRLWRGFATQVQQWRTIWTADGIHDTAIFIRPSS